MGERHHDSVAAVTAGAKGDLPIKVRERFFNLANKRIRELLDLDESQAQIGARWGVSQNTIHKIRSGSGGMGLKVLYGMRKDLRMTIDDILGLPHIDKQDEDTAESQIRAKREPR